MLEQSNSHLWRQVILFCVSYSALISARTWRGRVRLSYILLLRIGVGMECKCAFMKPAKDIRIREGRKIL
jgi:hypothetical protein